jgi:diketogulonate reductase-like aldo/keto reductase
VVIAWRPLALGKLAKLQILDDLSHKYHKTPSQIALNWLISKKGVVAIPKSSSIAHIQENLGSLGWHMSQADYDLLERCREF